MIYDYSALRGRIKEVFGTQEAFAKKVNMSNAGLSQRLNNATKFTQNEISKSCEILNIDKEEISRYFFKEKVQKI